MSNNKALIAFNRVSGMFEVIYQGNVVGKYKAYTMALYCLKQYV